MAHKRTHTDTHATAEGINVQPTCESCQLRKVAAAWKLIDKDTRDSVLSLADTLLGDQETTE